MAAALNGSSGRRLTSPMRLTTLALSVVLVVALFGRTSDAIDLMKLIEQAQRHRALKRASEYPIAYQSNLYYT